MMMDLMSSVVDGLLVFLGVVAVLAGGMQTIQSDTATMSTTSGLAHIHTTEPSQTNTSLCKAA
jgi:hypothetical protein